MKTPQEIVDYCRENECCPLAAALKIKVYPETDWSKLTSSWDRNPNPAEAAKLLGIDRLYARTVAGLWDIGSKYVSAEHLLAVMSLEEK